MIEESKEVQTEKVLKVFEEMRKAEEYLKQWNASWIEEYSQACLVNDLWIPDSFKAYFEDKYFGQYKLYDMVPFLEGVPLIQATLTDDFDREYPASFGTITWKGIESKKARRKIIFKNNGDISLIKKPKSEKQREQTTYEASYNVMKDGFNLTVNEGADVLGIVDNARVMYITYRGIFIRIDKLSSQRSISLARTIDVQNKISANMDMTFDASNEVLRGINFNIETHENRGESQGKVNGTYQLSMQDYNYPKVQVKFFSKNFGVSEDLIMGDENFARIIDNPEGIDAQALIGRFIEVVREKVQEKNPGKLVVFGNLVNFSTDKEKLLEEEAIEMLKRIKSEVPLAGLVERIDACLNSLANTKEKGMKRERRNNESLICN